MSETPTLPQRDFSDVDAKRLAIILAVVAVWFICNWFALSAVSAVMLPADVGGKSGPWIIRPIRGVHFGATAVMAAITCPLILAPIQRNWPREDVELGSQYIPLQGRPLKSRLLLKSFLLFIGYSVCFAFYLLSWTKIGPDGIQYRLPWSTTLYQYREIQALEAIPEGERSESITQNGPWYEIKMKDGSRITFSLDNEGTSTEEMASIALYAADQSGLRWMRRRDSKKR